MIVVDNTMMLREDESCGRGRRAHVYGKPDRKSYYSYCFEKSNTVTAE